MQITEPTPLTRDCDHILMPPRVPDSHRVSIVFISRALFLGTLHSFNAVYTMFCSDGSEVDKFESDVRAIVFDLAELPVLVLPWPAFDGADGAGARLFGHVQFRAQAAVRW